MNTRDESFFTEVQIDALCHARWGAPAPPRDRWAIDHWPPGLPDDFDHQLRAMGLPCGADPGRTHYTLLQVVGGWKIYKVADLAAQTAFLLEQAAAKTLFRATREM